MTNPPFTPSSPQFAAALIYANEIHAQQRRKGTNIPYITHLLAVAAIVGENGGSERAVIAALLHDAVEDQGGEARLHDIQTRFGEAVATIVRGCTDTLITPKPPWRARKEQYLAHLAAATPEILLVSVADKLHNARAILADLRAAGATTWARFNGGREGTLWYYRALVQIYTARHVGPLAAELDRVVTALETYSEGTA